MINAYITEWLSLIFKFLHVITGIAWIGASFYFNWLENKLNRVANRDKISGHLWAVHGGGFYYLEKYKKYPDKLPSELHWFKWEAYFTGISGFFLLSIIYYLNPQTYLLNNSSNISDTLAVVYSIIGIVGFWLVYDFLCKSKIVKNNIMFLIIITVFIAFSSYLYNIIYSAKAVYVQLGAMLGITMVLNVFFVIIPVQKVLVKSCADKKEVSRELGLKGYTRSRHNNYFTLPVLLAMISVHYPLLYSADNSWIILVIAFAIAFMIRHYFNLRGIGKKQNSIILLIIFMVILSGFILLPKINTTSNKSTKISFSQVKVILDKHCISCHSSSPTDSVFTTPPNGFVIDTEDKEMILKSWELIYNRSVATESMPLGNKTKMTQEEREVLGNWIRNNDSMQK